MQLQIYALAIGPAVSADPDYLNFLQLEEFKKRKAAAAAKKAGTPSITPQSTPLVTPIKGPEANANKPTPSAAPKAVNATARRALPAGQPVVPATLGKNETAHTTVSHVEVPASQPSASKARENSEQAPPLAPSEIGATPAQRQGQHTAQAFAQPQPYENGNDVAHSRQPTVSSAAEQQRMHQLEQQLLEAQRQSKDQVRGLQQALSDRQGALQALQSQHAAAEQAAAGLRQELAQQEAEKEELRQQLQHLEAEQQMRLNAQSKELSSLNRSLQGQVRILDLFSPHCRTC